MALFNYTAKEITLKVVYYGPGFSGKTTNLQRLHSILPFNAKGKLISMATEGDRTIFFDFLPVAMGKIKEFNIRCQLYTVPGQIRYNATRRLVLRAADAVVFVADSQREMREQNIESINNMRENLIVNNISPDIPVVFQYNKRDTSDIMSIEELNKDLNKDNTPFLEAVAVEGKGVEDTFSVVTKNVLDYIRKKYNVDIEIPETSIIPEKTSSSEPSAHEGQDHIIVRHSKPSTSEMQKQSTTPFSKSKLVKEPDIEERKAISPQPVTPDLSKLISAINSLKDAVSGISRSLKEMQINQTRSVDVLKEMQINQDRSVDVLKEIQINQARSVGVLKELKQIFSEVREKRRFRRLFK